MNNYLKSYRENHNVFILLLFPVAVLSKLVEHLFLPANYFFDSNRINAMVLDPNSSIAWNTGSYKMASSIFREINIFGFTTILQWSLFVGSVFTILVIVMLCKVKYVSNSQSIFGLMCVGLLNIYIFNISKDAIQFLIYFVMYIVISVQKIPKFIKPVIVVLLMYWESTVYRSYYIIMGFFFLVIYIVFSFIRKKCKKIKVIHYIFIVVGMFAMVFVFLTMAQKLFPDEYLDVMSARNYSNNQGQTSVIKEVYEHNNNINIFMVDYVIDSVRMMIPIELLKNGVFYIPFILFQLFMLFYLVRGIKRIKYLEDNTFIAVCIFLAYFLGSVLFEPDFGSFVRHEAATFPIIVLMIFNKDMWDNKIYKSFKEIEDTE